MLGTLGIPSGGGGCAAHVPPRCRGETKSQSKWQSVGTVCIKALCDEMRDIAKGMSKEAPKAYQNSVRDVPKPSKIEPRDALGSQNAALKLPRPAKRQQRALKKCPRDAQEASKRGLELPKSV